MAEPRLELRARLRDRVESHVRVLQPAELRAFALERARPRRRQQEPVDAPGDDVDLSIQLRQPDAVDHIVRGPEDVDPRRRRDVELVGGHGGRARVANLPPPLVPDDVHSHRRRARVRRRRRTDHEHVGPEEQRGQQDDRERNAEADDEPGRTALAEPERQRRLVTTKPSEQQ